MNLHQFTLMDQGDEIAWLEFLSANEQSHQTIAVGIEGKGKSSIRLPMTGDPKNDPNWLSDHNRMHESECIALGFPAVNLSDYDLKDAAQFAEWMYIHAALHAAENSILGVY